MSSLTSPNGEASVHQLRVDPSRSMKAVTAEVSGLLDGMEDDRRQSSALLASELIAQVVAPAPGWNDQPIGLTIQLRGDVVRMEASGPVAPAIDAAVENGAVADDPMADWGTFVIDRLADRWGLSGGSKRSIWAEVATAA